MVEKTPQDKLVLGIPAGSLQESTLDLLGRAGYNVSVSSRSYYPSIDDEQISPLLLRAQEMSHFIEAANVDVGLTGYDWICENGSDVVEIAELVYAKARLRPVRWVLAVPEESSVRTVEDLEGGTIATELVNVTRKYFADKSITVDVEFSWGATEVKARLPQLYDGIVDVTETGGSLRANRLRVVDTIMTSSTRLIANKDTMKIKWKAEKIRNIALLLQGAIEARQKTGLKMNVPADGLEKIMKLLPAERSPTVSKLAEEGWVAVEVIIEERIERDLVPQLKQAGAAGIITYPLNKVIP
ncbi:MAG: ATP phosphoribosyltransferase [Phycisphaerae bacterium]|nr:ATP phosphoribosyltransferase [Phycisphaerae bacterium]